MYSQYAFVGVPLHPARIACWFSRATPHWSNFCTRDGIHSQTFGRSVRESKIIEANETVVSPEPVSIIDDATCDTNTVTVNSPIPSETTGKILGTLWNSNEDTLTIDSDEMLCLTELLEIPYLTKRILLSSISKIFDPMGLASPAIVMMKVIFQKLCKSGLDWDDPVDRDTQKTWDSWLRDVAKTKTLQ